MPVKRAIPPNNGMFFIIFIGYQWLSLMDTINEYDIIYKWFDHLKSNHHFINGYAIIPNQVHALISFINTTQSINTSSAMIKDLWCMKLLTGWKKI